MRVGHQGSTLRGKSMTKAEKVVMQVNRYVHPCEKIPDFLKAEDLETFAIDYSTRENERIKGFLTAFDEMLF